MSLIYECDKCGYMEKCEDHYESCGPKTWSKVVLNVTSGTATRSGFSRLLCPTCATKYGITEIAVKELEKDSVEKLADYLYEVIETFVEEATDNL